MFLLPLPVVAALLAVDAIEVRSFTECPSGDAITAQLRPLLPDGPGQEPLGDVAWVDPVAQGAAAEGEVGRGEGGAVEVRLRLVRSDATIVGDRRLVLQGSCDDMAETLAAVLAAWETPPVPHVAPATGTLQEANPPLAGATASEKIEHPASAPVRLAIGASAGSAFVGGMAATGSLELVVGRATLHWQARLAVMTQTRRQRGLDPGQVSWRHTGAFMGVGWRSLGPRWSVTADAGPVLGWATVVGQGFEPSRKKSAFEYGVGVALRARRSIGAWAVWIEGQTTVWAENQRAVLTGSSNQVDLPGFDVMISLGGSREVLR